jgi:hypothetical protein
VSRTDAPKDKASLIRQAGGILIRKGKIEIPLSEGEIHELLEILARTLPAGPGRDYALLIRRHQLQLDLAVAVAEQTAAQAAQLLRLLRMATSLAEGPPAELDGLAAAGLPADTDRTERTAGARFVAESGQAAAAGASK